MKKIFLVQTLLERYNGQTFYVPVEAFSTEEEAETYIKYNGNDSQQFKIQPIPLDAEIDKSEKMWNVWVDIYGNCQSHWCRTTHFSILERELISYSDEVDGAAHPVIGFNIMAYTYKNAIKRAKKRLDDVLRLENTRFPYLRKKCVEFAPSGGIQLVEYPRYPTYDFKTGEILLYSMTEKLADGVEAKVTYY